jgi:hypothetical protein
MRSALLSLGLVLAIAACGNSKQPSFPSLCVGQVPPPAACNTACDAKPDAVNSCPTGYHCTADGKCDSVCTENGNQCGGGYDCTSNGQCISSTGCNGLECKITDCTKMGMPQTAITGTVFAPNGTLPLWGVNVFVPNVAPGAFADGAGCARCSDEIPSDAIALTVTDESGKFNLPAVPDGDNVPLVISVGKWRRQIKIPHINACSTTTLTAMDTSLPKSQDDIVGSTTSVDMPKIAISTGSADSLECLVRRLGIADKEITTDAGTGRIQLFSDNGATVQNNGVGTSSFDAGFAGGKGAFSDSKTLWGVGADPGKLAKYDIVILSCEGDQHVETKPQEAMDHLKAYADLGGRAFLSHWHNIWLEGSNHGNNANANVKPQVWADPAKPIANWSNGGDTGNGTVDTIDEVANPKGMAFGTWMFNVHGNMATPRDSVPLVDGTGKSTLNSVDAMRVEQWVYLQKDANTRVTQNFQFTTPVGTPLAERCGKVVFSDMHVSGGPTQVMNKIPPYPTSCGATTTLSDQEKALAFMFFDIASCVGTLF